MLSGDADSLVLYLRRVRSALTSDNTLLWIKHNSILWNSGASMPRGFPTIVQIDLESFF